MNASPPPSHRRPPPPPPPPYSQPGVPNESVIQRYKLVWRVFMVANLGLGAYIFAKAKLKSASMKSEPPTIKKEPPPPPQPVQPSPNEDLLEERDFMPSTPIAKLVKEREPVPEDQQREVFEWILEEKRKVKPVNKAEKKQIDEEKAILKRFIRSDSIPPY